MDPITPNNGENSKLKLTILSIIAIVIILFPLFKSALVFDTKIESNEKSDESVEKLIVVNKLFEEFPGIGVDIALIEPPVTVINVHPNTPAMLADLKPWDEIHKVNGIEIKSTKELKKICRETPIGRHIDLEIRRGDKTLQKKVRVIILKPRLIVEPK